MEFLLEIIVNNIEVVSLKHIIIAGCSRTGKTTLSEMFAKTGFTHYKMDSIKRGIYDNFCSSEYNNWKDISPKMAHLISTIINEGNFDKTYNQEFYCIDTCHLYPVDIVNENLKNTIIIFLGYPNIDKYQKLTEIRKYDANNIWTSNKSDNELIANIELGIAYSLEAKKQCELLGIPFFDTSVNYSKTLEKAYNYVKQELIEERN